MKIEACPFCKSSVSPQVDFFKDEEYAEGNDYYAVVCDLVFSKGCGARGPHRSTTSRAISAWNACSPTKDPSQGNKNHGAL